MAKPRPEDDSDVERMLNMCLDHNGRIMAAVVVEGTLVGG